MQLVYCLMVHMPGLLPTCLRWEPARTWGLGEVSLLNPSLSGAQPSPQGLPCAPPSKVLPWRLQEKCKESEVESGRGVEAGQLALLLEVELEPRLRILLGKEPQTVRMLGPSTPQPLSLPVAT